MWPRHRHVAVVLVWNIGLVDSAIDLEGSAAVSPMSEEDEASPISDVGTYYPDQHDCPLPCIDFANVHGWIPYLSVKRLERCQEPMLLQLSVTQPLDDPQSTILIRSCSLGSPVDATSRTPRLVENPKKDDNLFRSSLDEALACRDAETATSGKLDLNIGSDDGSSGGEDVQEASSLIHGIQEFFKAQDNCDEAFVFAYHKKTVAGVYIGERLGKQTATSALEALSVYLGDRGRGPPRRLVAQLCRGEHDPEDIFGISIDTTGDLAKVQRTAYEWSLGDCANTQGLDSSGTLADARIWKIQVNNNTHIRNDTADALSDFSLYDSSREKGRSPRTKRRTCRHIQVVAGDSCGSLLSRCKNISERHLLRFNPRPNFCSTLMPDEYICCSGGEPYTAPKPQPNADGTCAAHLIKNGDTCFSLAKSNGISVEDIETWNRKKTWAWSGCNNLMAGYHVCLSNGDPPLPPPQQGAECGPTVPGTAAKALKGFKFDKLLSTSFAMANLNPCPLRACCSNWGFCGIFPTHCQVHAPEGGGPGSKKPGHSSTCVSNCGMDIEKNSGPPAAFQRIGYYESWNMQRDCLWLKAKDANTDGTYTHIHWAFADIEVDSWKPVIKDPHHQWADFKGLKSSGVKRILSFGGWAYSTEPESYGILRSAIIEHRETFSANLARFAADEDIDGIDIDWEYPGAPDILVGGQPIGQKRDGIDYLKFLTVLREKLDAQKSLSIAAPASFWYLKNFPIQRIAKIIDYIVYMTYDLHGQWDYGNVNAFDSCSSGKCIRSHVNLTETRTALAIITKAGVPNNKILVGESSYGRSFRMAKEGCWSPDCDFTGSRIQSDANPGRCTRTAGYISNAEINEILKRGGAQSFHDHRSNTDVILYKGDYIGYMTSETKDTRRADWKGLNFAGTIDWALDLQDFSTDDYEALPTVPQSGIGCIFGTDVSDNSGDDAGDVPAMADDEGQVPDVTKEPTYVDYDAVRRENLDNCFVFKNIDRRDKMLAPCLNYCQLTIKEAREQGRTTNYGCVANFPLDKELPWQMFPESDRLAVPGTCHCDNWLLNELADTILEAMPTIAQIGCYILMSSFKLVLNEGLGYLGVAGKIADAGMDMLATAAQMASYLYSQEEDPEGAFSWWLKPCGGTDLVPDEIKRVFDALNQVSSDRTSFKRPKNIRQGSGRKGDDANPTRAPSRPQRPNGDDSARPGPTSRRCHVPVHRSTVRGGVGLNTLRLLSCDRQSRTKTSEMVITSLIYAPNAQITEITKTCSQQWSQACYHYSSANRENKHWQTLTCPPEAAAPNKRYDASATRTWEAEHRGNGWKDEAHRALQGSCHMDEWPPAYLIGAEHPARLNAGINRLGQRVRYLPGNENTGAASQWRSVCFAPLVREFSDAEFRRLVERDRKAFKTVNKKGDEQIHASATVTLRPQFVFDFAHSANPPHDDGLWDNPCWPSRIAANDPGFALLSLDEWYDKNPPPRWDYRRPYVQGQNGD